MKFSVRHILAAGLTVFMMTLTFVQPVFAAIDPLSDSCKSGSGSQLCTPQKPLFGAGGTWTNIINTMIFVIGSIAVLMIVIGGLRYVLSGGDTGATKGAKDTILYAVIGLVVATMAYAIVNFVVSNL